MDVKDLRSDAVLCERNNDGTKYAPSSGTLPCTRNKSYQDMGASPLGKVDAASARPCAVIGPDRVLPPPVSIEPFKKGTYEAWCAENAYRHPPEYPHKMPNFQTPIRNISPRQTFQENMQRIMVPPGYNALKGKEESNFPIDKNVSLSKNMKSNIPSETKYCEVPYTVNPTNNEQKNVRNTELCVSNVNPVLARTAPHGWPPNLRPSRPYAAPELYQYPEYTNCAAPRPTPMTRPQRAVHEDPAMYPDPYHDGNIRYKPYPTLKDRYPPARYEYIGNYSNPFHPPSAFPPHKSIPPPYAYPQVPLKYLDGRIAETMMEGYQRPGPQGNYNMPFRNQMIHPAYGPVLGNCIQNKYPCPPDSSLKSGAVNKLPYDTNKMYLDYENARSKTFPVPESFYFNEMARSHHPKNQIMSNYSTGNVHNIPPHPYYRKENSPMKTYEYMPHFRNMDPSIMLSRIPSQFSPSSIAISPSDSNGSNETTQMQNNSQEDCGYVSQSSTTSIRSLDSVINRPSNDFYRRYDARYGPLVRTSMISKSEQNSNNIMNSKDKKNIDVRQFLQMWNEVDDENGENSTKDIVTQLHTNNSNKLPNQYEIHKNQDQLYVLGLVNVPSEELGKYEHIQKISKLPENIKGYNNIELLNQFEEVIESTNVNNFSPKPPVTRDNMTYRGPINASLSQQTAVLLPRPVSPLDVEAKISQSVIHKEVGCNFEIKPCSPKMLNVEIAAPVQTVLGERAIEKVTNPLIIGSQMIHTDDKINCNMLNPDNRNTSSETLKIPSCKMINTPFSANEPVRPNYCLQDLESNSGVCLASLPRLDNDIELNFPEVNQQFINANKGESVITKTKDLSPLITDEPENLLIKSNEKSVKKESESIYELSPITESEKEFSKLSKYRKLKKNGPELPERESPSSQNIRTDSVIIKNPENSKVIEHNKETLDYVNKLTDCIQNDLDDLNRHCKKPINHDVSEKELDGLTSSSIDTNMPVAIDFSLKSENNIKIASPVDRDAFNNSLVQSSSPTDKQQKKSQLYNTDSESCIQTKNDAPTLTTKVNDESTSQDNIRENTLHLGLQLESDINVKSPIPCKTESPGKKICEEKIFNRLSNNLNGDSLNKPCDGEQLIGGNEDLDDLPLATIGPEVNQTLCNQIDESIKSPKVSNEVLETPSTEPIINYDNQTNNSYTLCVPPVIESDTLSYEGDADYTVNDNASEQNDIVKSDNSIQECGSNLDNKLLNDPENTKNGVVHSDENKDINRSDCISALDVLGTDSIYKKNTASNNVFIKSGEADCQENLKFNFKVENSLKGQNKLNQLHKELFSPWIQNLIILNEGPTNCQTSSTHINTSFNKVEQSIEAVADTMDLLKCSADEEKQIANESDFDSKIRNTTAISSIDVKGNGECEATQDNNKNDLNENKNCQVNNTDDLNENYTCTRDEASQETGDSMNENSLDHSVNENVETNINNDPKEIFNNSECCSNISLDNATKLLIDLGEEHLKQKNEDTLEDDKNTSEIIEQPLKDISVKTTLKRSLSDSALDRFNNDSNDEFQLGWQTKRRKKNIRHFIDPHLIEDSFNSVQGNRRNSISSMYNEENVSFCILIDNNCIITEEENGEQEKICYTEITENCLPTTEASPDEFESTELLTEVMLCSQEDNVQCSKTLTPEFSQEKSFEESWVEDIACVETVVSDEIDEGALDSTPSTPKEIYSSENEDSEVFICSDHTDKVKHIYGDKMCNDDAQFLETLYRTPQMDVNKTLINRESQISEECNQYYNNDSLEKVLSEPHNREEDLKLVSIPTDCSSRCSTESIQIGNTQLDKENLDTRNLSPIACNFFTDEDVIFNTDPNNLNDSSANMRKSREKTQDDTVHSCESSTDNVFSYSQRDEFNYTTSSSPEVSSTTSEERNSGIFLKITNYKGSRISQINDTEHGNKKISCKFTEVTEYSSSLHNMSSNRPLITKAAQKYIPPLKETIGDLKIRLPLPQHSLLKLKQLKLLKAEPKKSKHIQCYKKEIPKKPKPKFEDVLKSIDEIQFKIHKEKSKKVKKSVPKVVIKKNENGSHYASTTNKESFNPDLTGRKWQPWVFLEKNHFIDKMVVKNKKKAIYNHRKDAYVLAEKFQKYKSVGSAKFVISQPKLDETTNGQLKCTIRLKHA